MITKYNTGFYKITPPPSNPLWTLKYPRGEKAGVDGNRLGASLVTCQMMSSLAAVTRWKSLVPSPR